MRLLGRVLLGALPVCVAAGMAAQIVSGTVVSPTAAPIVMLDGLFADGMPMMSGVTGQPYSLVQTTKSAKTLADGTNVTNEREEHLMRDSDGRTRMEMYRTHDGAKEIEFVSIYDPVGRLRITLMPRMKMATVRHYPAIKPLTEEQKAAQKARVDAILARAKAAPSAAKAVHRPRLDVEPLGQKDIAGVLAEGRRTTHVIAVGERGNDRELRQTFETWTSPDLKIELERTIDDPINGKTQIVVTQLDRGDPDAALFKVPEGYQVRDEPTHEP